MSTSAAAVRTAARPVARPGTAGRPLRREAPQPRLRVVAPAAPGSRAGLAVLCVTLLAGGLLGLLMLNISLSRGAYELSDSQAAARQLSETRQALQEQVEVARAPQTLATKARELGMVPAPNTAFVEVPDGAVLGTPAEAQAPPKPKPAVSKKAASTKKPAAKKPAATKKGDDERKRTP